MNFYMYGIKLLTERGIFEHQALEIMHTVVTESCNPDSINNCISDRWADQIDLYPPMLQNLLLAGIEPFALAYIKEKCPEAWFRPIFDKEHPLRKEWDCSFQTFPITQNKK